MSAESISTTYLELVRERTALRDRCVLVDRALEGLRPLLPRDPAGEPIVIGPVIDAEVPPDLPDSKESLSASKSVAANGDAGAARDTRAEPRTGTPAPRDGKHGAILRILTDAPGSGLTAKEIAREWTPRQERNDPEIVKRNISALWDPLQRLVKDGLVIKDSRLYRVKEQSE